MSFNSLIEKAALRCNYYHIVGDYLEFGTYRGRSAINAVVKALAPGFGGALINRFHDIIEIEGTGACNGRQRNAEVSALDTDSPLVSSPSSLSGANLRY